ncbi:MAG TPA: type I 3-dehydroquinate dehydratase [Thermoplasmata archaeon]|nr:type I 3-dehydroquinate dehydratase [Thermoplasmata archaeon]
MNDHRPWLIATLPGRCATECRGEAEEAVRSGADLAEIRVDRWPEEERRGIADLFPSPLPLIATYRSQAEGGEGSDDLAIRQAVLGELGRHEFWALDYELARDHAPPSGPPHGSILSAHLAEGAPWESVRALLLRPEGTPRFVKVVVSANVADALVLLERAIPPPDEGRFLLHTAGPSGALFRALAGRLGFAGVYGSLPETPKRPPVEPSQIPVRRLRRFLAAAEPAPVYVLLGAAVGRSRSPELFSTWMEELSDEGLYITLDIRTEAELADVLTTLPRYGVRGFNITQPWKVPAFELADRDGPGAGPCGAANVLTVVAGEGLEAANTDLAAVLRRLTEWRDGGAWEGREMLVVGTGGAARAALSAGKALRAELRILGRNSSSAESLALEFGATVASGRPDRAASLIVQATSVGAPGSGPPAIDLLSWVGPGTRVLDFVYDPQDRWLESAARSRGAFYEDGYRLLVYQAAESYAIWFGHNVPPTLLAAALEGPP